MFQHSKYELPSAVIHISRVKSTVKPIMVEMIEKSVFPSRCLFPNSKTTDVKIRGNFWSSKKTPNHFCNHMRTDLTTLLGQKSKFYMKLKNLHI